MLGIFLTTILGPSLNTAIFYSIVCIFAFAGLVGGYFYGEKVFMTNTSFLGSYGVIRGISLYVGGFPNEGELYLLG